MNLFRNIALTILHAIIYLVLAVLSTGGGHGNFFLLIFIPVCVLNFIAVILSALTESTLGRIYFFIFILVHGAIISLLLLDIVATEPDWNRPTAREGAVISLGVYLIGQIVIWLSIFRSLKENKSLE